MHFERWFPAAVKQTKNKQKKKKNGGGDFVNRQHAKAEVDDVFWLWWYPAAVLAY